MKPLPIHFAPLQGFTEDVYRRLHNQIFGHVDCYYTPFLRIEHGSVRSKDLRDIKPEFNEGVNVVPQIICSNGKEAEMLTGTVISRGYRRIDINMGCPFPLQTRHGRGAGIMVAPDKVSEVCQVIKSHPEISFSVKMRLGLESGEDWKQVLPILNDTPLEHITLHPRIASQQYGGSVDMVSFEAFMQQCRHNLIYNGDIRSAQDIRNLQQQYPTLAGVMVGRGLLSRPSLAAEYAEGTEWARNQIINKIKELHSLLQQHYADTIPGESAQWQKLRTFWEYFEPVEGQDSLLERKQWKKIKKAGNMKNYMIAVEQIY